MTALILLWFFFNPFQPAPAKAPATRQEQLQRHKESPVNRQKSTPLTPAAENIHRALDRLLRQSQVGSGSDQSLFAARLSRFYAARRYQPVWTKPAMATELLSVVESSADDGLDPSDYHVAEIKVFLSQPPATPELQARYDLLLSDAFLTLAGHLRFGKVDPASIAQNLNYPDSRVRAALEARLQSAVAGERIAGVIKEQRQQHPGYERLRKGLLHYRALAEKGGWQGIAEGPGVKEGARDSRVPLFRKRLELAGELAPVLEDTSMVYSKELADAVRRFQKQHGAAVDGNPGPATVRAMNVSAERRIEQIRTNLERYRWLSNEIPSTCVLVNTAGFTLHYLENGRNRWETRVIVGQVERQTPVFKADMQYVIFNPRWVVPPTVFIKDVLPAVRKNRAYLAKKNLTIVDKDGQVVKPESVDWAHYSSSNFPYRLQQSSGDAGSLGRIKFMLPNRYMVYLHDTPSKELFAKSSRAFSSGCIRVENPQELAWLVLQDGAKWSRERIQVAINSGKTFSVPLPRRVPVVIVYLTAVGDGDELRFYDDIYSRDTAVLKSLEKPVPQSKKASFGL
ncbi:MAG: L,D-transpeptidase family protein [Chlorobiaceae bacterium]